MKDWTTIYRWIELGRVPSARVAGSLYLQLEGLREHVGAHGAQLLP